MARRTKTRKPITPRQRFWMNAVGWGLTIAGNVAVLILALLLWNNVYALLFTAAILFMFSGYPLLSAYRHAKKQRARLSASAGPLASQSS